jgi:hypothetical protein
LEFDRREAKVGKITRLQGYIKSSFLLAKRTSHALSIGLMIFNLLSHQEPRPASS